MNKWQGDNQPKEQRTLTWEQATHHNFFNSSQVILWELLAPGVAYLDARRMIGRGL